MFRIALITEYDGTDFAGYQIQDNGRSVQGELNRAVSELYKEQIKVTGCSRTDSGVHARMHVSSCDVPFFIPSEKIPLALNSLLPHDVAVTDAFYVTEDFNARFNTLGKRYVYRIVTGRRRHPLLEKYTSHVSYELNLDKMNEAAEFFAGEHDFATFCASGGSQLTTVRKLNYVKCRRSSSNANVVEIEVSGEAFLYNMVRIIAGTLVYVGTGKLDPEAVRVAIDSCDRKMAGKTMPASGLTLEEVFYDWDRYKIDENQLKFKNS